MKGGEGGSEGRMGVAGAGARQRKGREEGGEGEKEAGATAWEGEWLRRPRGLSPRTSKRWKMSRARKGEDRKG